MVDSSAVDPGVSIVPVCCSYLNMEQSGVVCNPEFTQPSVCCGRRIAVAYGASCAFILPFAHQCNLMVIGPGGYATKDFVKVGLGLSIVMAVTAVVLLAM